MILKETGLPLYLMVAISCAGLSSSSPAQQPSQAFLGTIDRPTPKLGFNTNGHVPPNIPLGASGANWTQQWFIDSTIYLYPEVLRFPGGTNSNHWDWQTGWFRSGYQPPSTPLTIRVEEFKPGLVGCNAEGLFVVNLETSDVGYEMDGLRHAAALGLKPALFELGNEHNLNGGTSYPLQDMSSSAYAQLAKSYYDSIKAVFPVSKVCAVGGNTGPHPNWHSDILQAIPGIDAFAFHVYLTANNADLVFDVNRALAIPFGSASNNTTLPFRYNAAGFSLLPATKEVWVTEYNLEETQIASTPVIAKTWTHTLYMTAMNHFFLSQPNVTMMLNHSLAASATHYESISKTDKHITANALSTKLLSDVARGSQRTQNITFSGTPSMTHGSATIPKLIGWRFQHAGSEKGFLCNFSADTFSVSLSGVFSNTMQFDQYSADTAFIVRGLSSLNKYSGTSTDSIVIYPFSITQVHTANATGIRGERTTIRNELRMYPNPSRHSITLQTDLLLTNGEVIVYSVTGQEIERIRQLSGNQVKIPTHRLTRGIYFVVLKHLDRLVTGKFIVD